MARNVEDVFGKGTSPVHAMRELRQGLANIAGAEYCEPGSEDSEVFRKSGFEMIIKAVQNLHSYALLIDDAANANFSPGTIQSGLEEWTAAAVLESTPLTMFSTTGETHGD